MDPMDLLLALKDPKAWLGLAVMWGITFLLNLVLANRSRIDAWAEANPKRAAVYKALRGSGLDPWLWLDAFALAFKKKVAERKLPEAKAKKPPALTVVMIMCLALPGLVACSPATLPKAKTQVGTVADVINEVARRGDQVYAVSVEACKRAEQVAVQHPDLAEAKRLVSAIRARCDIAFAALEQLKGAIDRVDALVLRFELKQATLEELVRAAMVARAAFEQADKSNRLLATYLEKPQ